MSENKTSLVLLHGYGFDHRIFTELNKLLKNPSLKILSPDLPGFGTSSLPPDYSMISAAAWLDAYLMAHVSGNVLLVGHSMGGYIALEHLSNTQQSKVTGLVLLHSHAMEDSDDKQKDREKKANFIKVHGKEAFLRIFYPNVFADEIPESFKPLQAEYEQSLRPEALSGYMLGMARRKNHLQTISNLSIPLHIYHGVHDKLMLEENALHMAAHLSKGRICLDKKSGHMAMLENPAYLAEFISEALLFHL